ncbi:MAG: hypothetical protein QY871_03720 [Dehalococcoides mccartyi]|uniref:Eco57I restriction-modification methylase domain-containing protein n=1 Tax=Dehalococcoides mccartyi TaxID=61435 RepID=UPI0025C8FFAF|nr:DNA methyltransferase [Dehalococcoides mccartyi]MDN4186168.1 hypothetical protein [Dehalococcoides mccartyi]
MKNQGLFSSLFIDKLKQSVTLDDAALGRMATLSQTWKNRDNHTTESLWESFLKQASGYLEFVPPPHPDGLGVYPLYENWNFNQCISVLYLISPGADIDDVNVGRFYPAKLLAQLKKRKLNWGILTDGNWWRLYSTKSSRPYEDFVELSLASTLEASDESEYGLFERFFHKDSFVTRNIATETPGSGDDEEENQKNESPSIEKCRLDLDREQSEKILEQYVKEPFLTQVDEVLQYICNGFIFATQKSGEEYTEEERAEIFESAVKLIYRCLFLFYAEARRLLPTDPEKIELYRRHSIQTLCLEARKFRWGKRQDADQYDLWKHLKGLINAVNDGDPEYGIMGYNGGLFDDEEERFLGKHQLRNDFLARALYLLAFVEPYNNEPDSEYAIPYEDLEVRHLGELYENILEFTVQLADADRIRRRTKKGTEILLASQTVKKPGDTYIKKGEVFFGESALERKQTGSYYTAESLVRFLNEKSIIQPLREAFERQYRQRFHEFLEQAVKGHDAGTRRGAAQSAAALVERFAEQELLNFKVCDPAMGSGHFLVDASNQMAGLVVSLLEEVPYVEGLAVSTTSHPNDWRRRITRHCLYGVDLNSLAVNLSKLSLWLNCFASEHKLTFLDHHLRCGNSLIGIRSLKQLSTIPERKNDHRNNGNQKLLFDYDDLSSLLANASKGISSITEIDEDDTDRQREVLQISREATSDLTYLADLYTAYLMDSSIPAGTYKELFEKLVKGKSAITSLNSSLMETFADVMLHKLSHSYFHWPLEFPDVFGPGTLGGFSAAVGNPPWDKVKPNSQEFFSIYIPDFRSFNSNKANNEAEKLMISNPGIREKWDNICTLFDNEIIYFHQPAAYRALGTGDINTFKLFCEQYLELLIHNGKMGMVIPSAIYIDRGCQEIRTLLFENSQIDFLYCFENRKAIFNIHRSFKFILFGSEKGRPTDRFKCAFMKHDPEELDKIDITAISVPLSTIRDSSPSLSVLEYKIQKDVSICSHLFTHPSINKQAGMLKDIFFSDEIHLTKASKAGIVSEVDTGGRVVWEGKMINIFDSYFSQPSMWISESLGKEFMAGKESPGNRRFWFQNYRLSYRRVAASTNERTILTNVIPKGVFSSYSLYNVLVNSGKKRAFYDVPSLPAQIYLLGIMSSFVFDYVARLKFSINLVPSEVCEIPVPDKSISDTFVGDMIARGARLICTTQDFEPLWKEIFIGNWQSLKFWYSPQAPIDTYGPAHEQEIRQRLRDDAKNLTPEWGAHCGVHDRLPDRRDTGDRAQLRAEIDAYVAHLYGLSHDDFAYILDTFPVLRKKEEKAFGEFMSKRKCLEEYDRLNKILGDKK